jgi:hypothetical protein
MTEVDVRSLPQIYTAREVSEAFAKLCRLMTTPESEAEAREWVQVLRAIGDGRLIIAGINGDRFVLASPPMAPWLKEEKQ